MIGAFGLANSQRFASSGFVWRYSQTRYQEGSCRGLSSRTKTELSFPKSSQTIHTMQKNNHLSGVHLCLFKTRPSILKIESGNVYFHANPYILPNAQSKHICIFTEVPEVPRSADPQFSNTRRSLLLSHEVEAEEKKIKLNV